MRTSSSLRGVAKVLPQRSQHDGKRSRRRKHRRIVTRCDRFRAQSGIRCQSVHQLDSVPAQRHWFSSKSCASERIITSETGSHSTSPEVPSCASASVTSAVGWHMIPDSVDTPPITWMMPGSARRKGPTTRSWSRFCGRTLNVRKVWFDQSEAAWVSPLPSTACHPPACRTDRTLSPRGP